MTAALPWMMIGGVTVGAIMYALMSEASASEPEEEGGVSKKPALDPDFASNCAAEGGIVLFSKEVNDWVCRIGSSDTSQTDAGKQQEEPEEPEPELPDNMFLVQSPGEADFKAGLALEQGLGREGLVMVVYTPAVADTIPPEAIIAATSFPDVTFLFYPESIAKAINAKAAVDFACGPTNNAVVNAFPTVLGPGGAGYGPQPAAAPWCVSGAGGALELRAALSTASDALV